MNNCPFKVLLCSCIFCYGALLWADELFDGYRVLALSAADQRAVLKSPQGEMRVLKQGDMLADTQHRVSQVLADKLVLRDERENTKGEIIWLHLAVGDKTPEVQRISHLKNQKQLNQLENGKPNSSSVHGGDNTGIGSSSSPKH